METMVLLMLQDKQMIENTAARSILSAITMANILIKVT